MLRLRAFGSVFDSGSAMELGSEPRYGCIALAESTQHMFKRYKRAGVLAALHGRIVLLDGVLHIPCRICSVGLICFCVSSCTGTVWFQIACVARNPDHVCQAYRKLLHILLMSERLAWFLAHKRARTNDK